MRLAALAAMAATVALGCSRIPARESGSFEVFVAGREAVTIDALALEVLDDDDSVATVSDSAADFPGSFRVESAPLGEYRVKVTGRDGLGVVLEAPGAPISVALDTTVALWVRLNERPFEDDDGDLVRNGEDPCPLIANETPGDGDGDGTADACDVCALISNPAQADADEDGQGDACEVPEPGVPQPFAPVREVFASRCALNACHGSLAPQAELLLKPEVAYEQIVGVAAIQEPALFRIAVGDTAGSYLFQKITDGTFSEGTRMPPPPPLGTEPLSVEEIALIRRWITDGAIP